MENNVLQRVVGRFVAPLEHSEGRFPVVIPVEPGSGPVLEDARGLLCPIPVIRLAARLAAGPVGGEVLLLADDAAAHPDVLAWCRGHRQELVSVSRDGPVLKILVRRLR